MARPKSISKFIRERRQENGLTQQELAIKLQVSQPMITYWENGKKPDAKMFKKIERILGSFSPASSTATTVVEQSLFSSWLRTERTKSGMSIQELADKARLPYATIWQIENNKISSPRPTTIKKIEKGLQLVFVESKGDTDHIIEHRGLGQFQEFNPYDKEERPKEPGVYVLYDISERPIYVGQGHKIADRIKEHEEKFWFKNPIVETAAYIKISDEKLRKSVETVLIKFLKSNAVINKQNVDR